MRGCPETKKFEALKISAGAIASVVIVEFILGYAVNSLSIISDGAHALLDFASILMLLLATKVSLKLPDEEHMYGHEKIEVFGGFIGGIILFATSVFLIIEAFYKIVGGELAVVKELELAGFAAIAYTLFIDFLRIKVLHPLEHESVTVKAGFYHSVADLGSTLIALLGFGIATLGFPIFDGLASIVLCIILGYLSIGLLKESVLDLVDSAPRNIIEDIRKIYTSACCTPVQTIKVRKAGRKIFVEVVVKMPDEINLEEAHNIILKAEEKIKKAFGKVEIITHVCPASDSKHY